MTEVFVRRGSVVVENPTKKLKEGLRVFQHTRNGGEYSEIFFMSQSGDTLSTLPGYAGRVLSLCPEAKVHDERVPMPPAQVERALDGVDKAWHDVITNSIKAGGGVVAIPDMLGTEGMASAIARSYPRSSLLDRGTPLTVIASRDRSSAKRTSLRMRELLPDRDVGTWSSGSYTDSEDIVVSTYGTLKELPLHLVGVFIGDDLTYGCFGDRSEGVSGIRNAARWGILSSPSGGWSCIGMDIEGLFGPVVAEATYRNAVESGIGVPVEVCWLPSPAPTERLGSAPVKVLEEIAIQRNSEMVRLVSDIVRRTPNDIGCVVYTDGYETMKKLSSNMPEGVSEAFAKMPVKLKKGILDGVEDGTIRKSIIDRGVGKFDVHQGVVIIATCGSGDALGVPIPWRRLERKGDRLFIVDFRHEWDVNNGRPGVLARNDEARMRQYRDLGFGQMSVSEVSELPFVCG